jgi:class 3 adenylate cyclase
MLTNETRASIQSLVYESLDEAETIWEQVGPKILKKAMDRMFESAEVSQIPGYPIVEPGKPRVDTFIAMVVDMRGSTEHLLCDISAKKAKVTMLQRVFYETSALLPAMAKVIMLEGGGVTEYLGDGVLGLFRVPDDSSKVLYAVNRASMNCIQTVNEIINPILETRYALPPLVIGVGLAMSKAVVTLVGSNEFRQPKAFGECIFRATKLSHGYNEVHTDVVIRNKYPSSKDGILRFLPRKIKDLDGYLLYRKE